MFTLYSTSGWISGAGVARFFYSTLQSKRAAPVALALAVQVLVYVEATAPDWVLYRHFSAAFADAGGPLASRNRRDHLPLPSSFRMWNPKTTGWLIQARLIHARAYSSSSLFKQRQANFGSSTSVCKGIHEVDPLRLLERGSKDQSCWFQQYSDAFLCPRSCCAACSSP